MSASAIPPTLLDLRGGEDQLLIEACEQFARNEPDAAAFAIRLAATRELDAIREQNILKRRTTLHFKRDAEGLESDAHEVCHRPDLAYSVRARTFSSGVSRTTSQPAETT
jgi:hypothetical protein